MLNGSVPSYPQYVEAAAVARRVAGVKDVHNYLEVALPHGDHRDDSRLTATANDALTLGRTVAVGVEATAKNGDVAVEAALHHSQRPKRVRYRDYLFLTAYAARLDTGTGELATSEIAAFITSQALITVRQDEGLDVGAVVERWDETPDLAKFGGRLRAVRAAGLHRRWAARGGPEPG